MVNEALVVLNKFAKSIPDIFMGPDRTGFILENIQHLSVEERSLLIEFVNHILTVMIDRGASDIEVGGPGTANYIWFRIQGNKQRVKDLPNLRNDEAAALIAVILNKNQHRHLMVNRNLDFSYTFKHQRLNQYVRFRADAYFDLDCLTLNMRAISNTIRPLEALEFHSYAIQTMSHQYIKFGLSLVTGITGSGKSSTLDSIIIVFPLFNI